MQGTEKASAPLTVKCSRVLTADEVCNIFVSAFEGGSNYWLQRADIIEGKDRKKPGLVWWGAPEVFAAPFSFEVRYDDPALDEGNGRGRKTLTQDDVVRGFEKCAADYPRHWADFVSENDDAETADVIMQCIVLGDVVYG